MSKPTESPDWATANDALKVETTAKQKTHGWTTSDDTIQGTPPRPNLLNQNWWQNAIGKHFAWVDDNTEPNLGGDPQFIDLWEWDTVNMTVNDVDSGVPFIDFIGYESDNQLSIRRADSGVPSNQTLWYEYRPETMYGGIWMEYMSMIGRGLAVQISDANDDVWTIYNANGLGLTEDPTTVLAPAHLDCISMEDGTAANRVMRVRLERGGVSSDVEVLKNGVSTNDFASFVTLTNANFLTHNPNGVRVGLYGPIGLVQANSFMTARSAGIARQPVKTWIRPIATTQASIPSSQTFGWPIKWKAGSSYEVHVVYGASGQLADGDVIFIDVQDASQGAAQIYQGKLSVGTSGRTITFQWNPRTSVDPDENNRGLAIFGFTNSIDKGANDASIPLLYQGLGDGNSNYRPNVLYVRELS